MYLCLTTCYKFKGCSKKISLCFIDLFLWLKYFIDELVNGSFVLAKPFPYITEIFYISPCIIFLIANSRPNMDGRIPHIWNVQVPLLMRVGICEDLLYGQVGLCVDFAYL